MKHVIDLYRETLHILILCIFVLHNKLIKELTET